jgi:hypothetical protein
MNEKFGDAKVDPLRASMLGASSLQVAVVYWGFASDRSRCERRGVCFRLRRQVVFNSRPRLHVTATFVDAGSLQVNKSQPPLLSPRDSALFGLAQV